MPADPKYLTDARCPRLDPPRYVRFRENAEPCTQYKVLDHSVWDFNEDRGGYCEHMDLAVIGLVPVDRLIPATHPDNWDIVDVAAGLTNQ